MSEKNVTKQKESSKLLFNKERLLYNVKDRFYRACNYFSIYAFIFIVYSGALLTDYLLFGFMQWLLRNDVQNYPIVETWFNYARIGLALLFIVAAVIHGVLSTYGQIRLDVELSKEDKS